MEERSEEKERLKYTCGEREEGVRQIKRTEIWKNMEKQWTEIKRKERDIISERWRSKTRQIQNEKEIKRENKGHRQQHSRKGGGKDGKSWEVQKE